MPPQAHERGNRKTDIRLCTIGVERGITRTESASYDDGLINTDHQSLNAESSSVYLQGYCSHGVERPGFVTEEQRDSAKI